MLKWLRRFAVLLVVAVCAVTIVGVWMLRYQGRLNIDWKKLPWGQVSFDEYGIPTIEAKNWDDLVRLQGYIHASERMWQMDLIRRHTSGRLSELFGLKAL